MDDFPEVCFLQDIKRELRGIRTQYYDMGVGVMRDYTLKLRDLNSSHTFNWVVRGTGTPKDRDDVKRREV